MHPHLAKLDLRGLKVVFIGYKPKRRTYKLYNPAGERAHVLLDVVFNENTFWQWNDVVEAYQNPEQFTVEYFITETREEGAQHRALSTPQTAALGTPTPTPAATPDAPPKPVEFTAPHTVDSMLDVDHDDGLVAREHEEEVSNCTPSERMN